MTRPGPAAARAAEPALTQAPSPAEAVAATGPAPELTAALAPGAAAEAAAVASAPDAIPELDVEVVRSTRARRVSVRVDRSTARVRVTLPQRAPASEVDRALLRHRRWIAARLAEAHAVRAQVEARGNRIQVWGDELELVADPGRQRVHAKDGRLLLPPGNPDAAQRWLRAQARERLAPRTHAAAQALGKRVQRVSIGDAKTRWGSCTARGTITYSWRLVIAPPWVAEAIVWHEVCHLVELNHSDRFWSLLRHHEPRTDEARAWLRTHGATLMLPAL